MNDFVKTEEEKNGFQESVLPPLTKNYKKVWGWVDEDTGQMVLIPLKENYLGVGWCALYQDFSNTIAKLRLTGEEMRVLFKLFAELDFENRLVISHKQCAEEIGMYRPSFSKAIKGLRDRNLILEEDPLGVRKTYRLNPFLAHKGKGRQSTIYDFDRLFREKMSSKGKDDT